MAIWSRITGAIAGIGVGGAAAAAMEPILEVPRQKAWSGEPNRILDLGSLARLVATGLLDESKALDEAKRNGYDANRLRARIQLFLAVPGIGELDRMLNRNEITREQFNHALSKHGIEKQWWDAYFDLLSEKLDPGQLAAAIHRGLIPDPGLLKGEQPTPPFNVEAYPVYPIPAVAEAAASGYDKDRLGVLVGLQGLPMGPHEAAQALFRGIITRGDYIRAFNESNNRNEWAEAVLEQSRQIPTARDFFENALRGYHSFEWALEQAKRHGMSEADATTIYQNQGRPMNIRQITQALSRGGVFKPEPGELTDPYKASIVEGNVKPAYYDLAESLKYTLPSPFVMRQLTASGVWSEAKAAKRLKDSGWIPQDADEAAHAWATGTGSTADPYVSKADTQLWNTLHRSYVAGESDDQTVLNHFVTLGIDEAARPQILLRWAAERALVREQLTPAQVKKAYDKGAINPATGVAWTRSDAITALLGRGYSLEQAEAYLNIPAGQ